MSLKTIVEKIFQQGLPPTEALELINAEVSRLLARADHARADRQRAADRISRGEPLRRLTEQEGELLAFIDTTKQKIRTIAGLIESMPFGDQRLRHRQRVTGLEQEIRTANAKLRAVRAAINQRKKTELAEEFVHQAGIVLDREQLGAIWDRANAALQEAQQ